MEKIRKKEKKLIFNEHFLDESGHDKPNIETNGTYDEKCTGEKNSKLCGSISSDHVNNGSNGKT